MIQFLTQVQEKLQAFDSFEGDVDDILSEFLLLQFHLMEPQHGIVRAQMLSETLEMQKWMDRPAELLLRALRERGLIRQDIDPYDLLIAFKIIHLGLTGMWAMEGPPFAHTEKLIRLQMKILSEGIRAGEAYEV